MLVPTGSASNRPLVADLEIRPAATIQLNGGGAEPEVSAHGKITRPIKDKSTKSQILGLIAERTGLTRKQAGSVISAAPGVTVL